MRASGPREAQRLVAAPHRDPDALAEVAALGERAAAELAAIARVGAVEPEGELDAVAEQEVHLAAAQRLARRFGVGIGLRLRLGEEGLGVGLVRGAADDRDPAALDALRHDLARGKVAAGDEPGGRA